MKHLRILILIPLTLLLTGSVTQQHLMVVARKNVAGGGPSYLLSEDFEGTGTPTGWTINSGSLMDFDSTTDPLAGSKSYLQPDEAMQIITGDFTSTPDTVYVGFLMTISAAPSTAANFLILRSAADANVTIISVESGGLGLRTQSVGGTLSSGTTNDISTTAGAGTPVKIVFTKGTGSDATTSVYVASGGAWGTAVTSSNGTTTAAASYLLFTLAATIDRSWQFDNFIVSDSDIDVVDITGL